MLIANRRAQVVYENRATNLTDEFATYLAKIYPEHELDVFKTISPGNLDIYLAKYPELRASDTVMALVQQIRSIRDASYDNQLQEIDIMRRMRYRVRSPLIVPWLVRRVPISEEGR
jgi:hypothetical protein